MHVLSPLIQLTIPSFLVVSLIRNVVFATSSLLIVILAILALKKNTRAMIELYITSTLALSMALMKSIVGKRSIVWEKIESMREI